MPVRPNSDSDRRSRRTVPTEIDKLTTDLNSLITTLEPDLAAGQLLYLRLRWRDQLLRAKRRERGTRAKVLWMRTTGAVLAVLVPAFLGMQGPWFDTAAFVSSLGVAVLTAVEGVLRNGIRWRISRVVADDLHAEGWAFAHGLGPYDAEGSVTPSDLFPTFANWVERILNRYSDEYLQEITASVNRLDTAQGPGEPGFPQRA